MKPERKAPIGGRVEDELRTWLRGRDAGPAPDRLRFRVGRVTRVAEQTAPRRIWALLRPIAAVGGVVAVAVLVLFAATLRGPAGPLASGPIPTTSPSPTIPPGLQFPNGLWPRTGAVLAVPLDGPLLAVLTLVPLLLAVLLLAHLAKRSFSDAHRSVADDSDARRSVADEPPGAGLRRTRSRRSSVLRMLGVLLAAALIVVSWDLLQFTQTAPPLQYGSGFGSDPTHTLGYRMSAGGGPEETYMAFVPGGQLRLTLTLANNGQLPLTVTSFDTERFRVDQPAGAFVSSVEILLPPGATFGGWSPADYHTEAFHPFELQPQSETEFALILHLKDCRSVAPGPTPAPDATSNGTYLPTTGYVTIGELPFRYSVLGVEREIDVPLNEAIGLVFGSKAVTC